MQAYILSFPERLAPYDKKRKFFDCCFYGEKYQLKHLFTREEALILKQSLESRKQEPTFWDLRIMAVETKSWQHLFFVLSSYLKQF